MKGFNDMNDAELVTLAKLNSEEAKLELINRCKDPISFLASKCQRMCFNQVDLEDLISECHIAVLKAIETYDDSQGSSFAHYSKFFIRKRLYRFIEKRIKSVKIVHVEDKYLERIKSPKTLQDVLRDLSINPKSKRDSDIIAMLLQGYNQTEVAEEFKLSRTRIRDILRESIK